MSDHVWVWGASLFIGKTLPWQFCKVCGVVKRRDGQNKPCKGPTKLREMEK